MNAIHIGSWKTATTTIQTLCRKNIRRIEGNGYFFIDQRTKEHSQIFQPKYRRDIKRIQNYGEQADIEESIKIFENLFGNEKQYSFFHSWEGMLGHPFNSSPNQMYHPRETSYWLKRLGSGRELRVIISIRRQTDLVEAMYAQEVRKGRASSGIDKFISEKVPEDLSWAAVIQPIIDGLGKENVDIVPYEWIKSGDDKFLDSIFQDILDLDKIKTSIHSNPSYSHVAVEISRLANLFLEKKDISKLEKFLSENFSNQTHRRAYFLTEDLSEKLKEKFFHKDKDFFNRCFPNLNLGELGYFK